MRTNGQCDGVETHYVKSRNVFVRVKLNGNDSLHSEFLGRMDLSRSPEGRKSLGQGNRLRPPLLSRKRKRVSYGSRVVVFAGPQQMGEPVGDFAGRRMRSELMEKFPCRGSSKIVPFV